MCRCGFYGVLRCACGFVLCGVVSCGEVCGVVCVGWCGGMWFV